MKEPFKDVSQDTPEKAQTRINDEIKAIEDMLSKPRPPTQQLTPSGKLRDLGNKLGREAANDRRVDLNQQLEDHKAVYGDRTKTQGKSKGMDM